MQAFRPQWAEVGKPKNQKNQKNNKGVNTYDDISKVDRISKSVRERKN